MPVKAFCLDYRKGVTRRERRSRPVRALHFSAHGSCPTPQERRKHKHRTSSRSSKTQRLPRVASSRLSKVPSLRHPGCRGTRCQQPRRAPQFFRRTHSSIRKSSSHSSARGSRVSTAPLACTLSASILSVLGPPASRHIEQFSAQTGPSLRIDVSHCVAFDGTGYLADSCRTTGRIHPESRHRLTLDDLLQRSLCDGDPVVAEDDRHRCSAGRRARRLAQQAKSLRLHRQAGRSRIARKLRGRGGETAGRHVDLVGCTASAVGAFVKIYCTYQLKRLRLRLRHRLAA